MSLRVGRIVLSGCWYLLFGIFVGWKICGHIGRVACVSASFEHGLETAGLFCALASQGGGEGALFSVS